MKDWDIDETRSCLVELPEDIIIDLPPPYKQYAERENPRILIEFIGMFPFIFVVFKQEHIYLSIDTNDYANVCEYNDRIENYTAIFPQRHNHIGESFPNSGIVAQLHGYTSSIEEVKALTSVNVYAYYKNPQFPDIFINDIYDYGFIVSYVKDEIEFDVIQRFDGLHDIRFDYYKDERGEFEIDISIELYDLLSEEGTESKCGINISALFSKINKDYNFYKHLFTNYQSWFDQITQACESFTAHGIDLPMVII